MKISPFHGVEINKIGLHRGGEELAMPHNIMGNPVQ